MANTELQTVHSIAAGNATTLATWVTALVNTNADVVVPQPQHGKVWIGPKCTTDNADFTCVVYGLFGSTWNEIGRLTWSGQSTNNPATNDYRLAPQSVKIPRFGLSQCRHISIGRTAGTGTWTVLVWGDEK